MDFLFIWKPAALSNIELASFLRWYVTVEFNDPACAKRFCCTHDMLLENMKKVYSVFMIIT